MRPPAPLPYPLLIRAAGVGLLLLVLAAVLVPVVANWRLRRSNPAAVQQESSDVQAGEPDSDMPVEWWGIARDWAPEDEEALDRAIAARS